MSGATTGRAVPTAYGGQALIEGVMIRGVTCVSVAVRRPNGEVLTTAEPVGWPWARKLRRIPLVRGVIVLAEMLVIGTRALVFSANVAVEEEEGKQGDDKKPSSLSSVAVGGSLLFSLTLAIGIFFALPVLATRFIDAALGEPSSLVSNLVEGLVRLALFVSYIGLIGLMPDIRRVFAYHGAEHMAVHAHEHRDPLTVQEIRKYPTAHPRCGTAFILVVLVIAIIAHIFWTPPVLWERVVSRIALLPVIAGISYEVIRWSGRHAENPLVRLIIAPNLLLQSLTTRQPDDKQIEVAIHALEGAIAFDQEAAKPA
jgi:uncharacterized protein YqhQ